jgi:thiol-disulfide isomerase/thioredoxin
MTKILLSTTILALTLLLQGCSSDSDDMQDLNEMVATNEYVLTQTDQTQHTVLKVKNGFLLKEAKEKVLLINIFATWCPPCQAEASHLSSLQEKFKKELIILGVSVEEGISNEKLEDFAKEYRAKFPIVNSSQNRKLITAIAEELKVGRNFGIPLMALYKDGKLINFYQGATEEEFIESDIKKALGE